MVWELEIPTKSIDILIRIQKATMAIRDFLNKKGFIEVDIPILYPSKSVLYSGIKVKSNFINGYLRPVLTPYIRRWLILLRDTEIKKIYCIGKCFRDEASDEGHYPIYEGVGIGILDKDYIELMTLIEQLVKHLADKIIGDLKIDTDKGLVDLHNWSSIPYQNFNYKTNFNDPNIDIEKALDEYAKIGYSIIKPTFITEFPIQFGGPARLLTEFLKERAELFIGGMEVANISTFLTDYQKLSQWYSEHTSNIEDYLFEKEHLISISKLNNRLMSTGLIGLSRLYMILFGIKNISKTIAFPYF